MNTKNVVAGLGEIGTPIFKIISKQTSTYGYDINPKLMKKNTNQKYESLETSILHICIPFSKNFIKNCKSLSKLFNPKIIVIHSTISPYTTKNLQKELPSIPIIYSATRGVHKRMISDIKKYIKYFAIEKNAPNRKYAITKFSNLMKKCGVRTKKMSEPITLELAKIIVDTSYYGWLINYAQLSNVIARKHHVDYDEMWSFSDEIHKFLGNRPKMFPGYIGGHCVIPNLELIDDKQLWQIDKINNFYVKKVKDAKSYNKKYDKSKKKSYNK